jgi:hypothetical protein
LAVSESKRLALHRAARAALGEKEGDTLMELSPPANTDIATMQALERTEERLGARIDAVDARIDAVADRLDARIDAVAAELRTHTWKVVVGTGVALYVATVATAFAGTGILLRILEVI